MAIIPFRKKLLPYRFFHINYWIIGINLVIFMAGMVSQNLTYLLILSLQGIGEGHFWWQFVTWFLTEPFSMATVFNIVFNMVALVFFGNQVEHEMGSWHYLIFYGGIGLVSGLLGFGIFWLFGWQHAIFGSTTLVFAVLMMYAALYPDSVIYLMGIFPLRPPLLLLILSVIAVLVLLGTYGPLALVHLIGLVLAFLYVLVKYRRNPFRNLFG